MNVWLLMFHHISENRGNEPVETINCCWILWGFFPGLISRKQLKAEVLYAAAALAAEEA